MNNPADTLAALAKKLPTLATLDAVDDNDRSGKRPCHIPGLTIADVRALHAALASLKGETAKPKFTTGHCENHRKPGGCHLHNLQCGYPECDRRPVESTPSPAPQGGGEKLATVVSFLLGEGQLQGQHFGDAPYPGYGRFWWREWLRDAYSERIATPPQPGAQVSDAMVDRAIEGYWKSATSDGARPCISTAWMRDALAAALATPPAQQPGECAHANDVLAEDGVRFCNVCGAPKEKGNG